MAGDSPEVVVILAAGRGSRLAGEESLPKPLARVGGQPIVWRVLESFARIGVGEAIVVLGFRGDEVRRGIESGEPGLTVRFVDNPRWRLANGLSVLAARDAVAGRSFFLSMADHVFEPALLQSLARAAIPREGLILAVDRKLDQIFDMDDATKVRTADERIAEIGKQLTRFDAVDTGLFACSPGLFSALERAAAGNAEGDCSLSDGVTALAESGLAAVHDIGDVTWQDVDTPASRAHAEKLFG
jgi:choline kinase